MAKYDDMSFGKAFAAARREKGKGKTFTWKGKSYTTNYKEETGTDQAPTTSARPRARDEVVTRAQRAIQRSEDEKTSRKGPTSRPNNNPARTSSPRTTTTASSRPPEDPRTTGAGDNSPRRGGYSFNEWREMSRREREAAGLPTSIAGAQIYFRRSQTSGNSNSTGNKRSRPGGAAARGMAKGGMVKKTGYAKGGVVKANCGASMKPTQKGTKK